VAWEAWITKPHDPKLKSKLGPPVAELGFSLVAAGTSRELGEKKARAGEASASTPLQLWQ
jgi:hypothetical protein